MYTSIPAQEAVRAISEHIKENSEIPLILKAEQIEDLLEVVFCNTYFKYEDTIYKQTNGLPMGNCVSGIAAIIFMYRLERSVMRTAPIALYKRYADDICILTTDKDEAEKIMEIMNQQHHNINFEIEHPINGRTLRLLDFEFTVTSDGKTKFNFYKKKARKPIFLNYRSALPMQMKTNVIKNEIERIKDRCSYETDFQTNLRQLEKMLSANDYPNQTIRRMTASRHKPKKKEKERRENMIHVRLPYISDKIDNKIKNIVKRNNLPIQIYHNTRTLRHCVNTNEVTTECQMKDCEVKNKKLCNIKKVVYKIKCDKCGDSYIGSSVRPLHLRVKEHLRYRNSSVYLHKMKCGAEFSTEIMGRERDATSLRIREAIEIRRNQPEINSRQEREHLSELLF